MGSVRASGVMGDVVLFGREFGFGFLHGEAFLESKEKEMCI
jgi:hypothetical protein